MGHLNKRNIIIGVCGGIAAYKVCELIRLLVKQGAEVRVVMTQGAQAFVTPLTLQALSGHPVHTELLDAEAERGMGHIELARWADAVIIAPATAGTMAKLVAGQADNLLCTVVLATAAPVFIAPAMNQQMWAHSSTAANQQSLRQNGYTIIGPDSGEQACGDVGAGRMSEPHEIVTAVAQFFPSRDLDGKHVVITAGPTQEAIDPVRFLSNHSSGKMGFALAQACAEAGARVTLISGPVHLATPDKVDRKDVTSALDMLQTCEEACLSADILIACAAVADYRPMHYNEQKLKKQGSEGMSIELVQNPDIVASIAEQYPSLYRVGFAAETQDLIEHAKAKRIRKKLHMIVANDVSNGEVFGTDDNAVTLITEQSEVHLPSANKRVIAHQIITHIATELADSGTGSC